ncbi:hypothetical protein [Hymenobacter sp. BT188]|uniref:hypothetical protein n=1 Tax=Hymenobacter sp. BT188 TaxID=2763504 RepID=UPI001C9DF36D|nr:hypothetical protein [Hymenobacter sp. BT188]
MSNIKRILSKGISVEQFLKEDITEKNRLLDIEWQKSLNNILYDWQYLALAVICFDVNINSVDKIASITNIENKLLLGWLPKVSFLDFKDDEVTYISSSFKIFAEDKLKKYSDKVSDLLINYYLKSADDSSIINLASHYEKSKAYAPVVNLLTLDNLTQIISNSKSFGEIKSLINSGYKASGKMSGAYDSIFKFALHKSILLELQTADTREAEIQACVALRDNEKALAITSSAVLKEDRFKMLIIYAKECKARKVEIDQVIIKEITNAISNIDLDYIKENLLEIATNLAQVLPSLAIKLIERASEEGKENPSVEWLLAYLSAISSKQSDNNTTALDLSSDRTEEDFISAFFASVDKQSSDITALQIKKDILSFNSISDRLYMVRSWIKSNPTNSNAFEVMNLGIDLLLEDSSNNKPTTTALFDLSVPLPKLNNENNIVAYIDRLNALLQTINTPSIDWIRLQLLLIEAELRVNNANANARLCKLIEFVFSLEDVTIRAQAFARCWALIKSLFSSGFQEDEIIIRENEIKDWLSKELDNIILNTAQQFRELEPIIKVLALVDLEYTIALIERVNTLSRQNWCFISCINSYVTKPVNEWDIAALRRIIGKVKDENSLGEIALSIVKSAYKQNNNRIDGRHNFLQLLYIIEQIENDELSCYVIVKSIAVLLNKPKISSGLTKNYNIPIKKLKEHLKKCWLQLSNPWIRVNVGYKICADIAITDPDLAQEYYRESKELESLIFVDNITYASVTIKSIMIAVEACVGAFKYGLNPNFEEIGYLVGNINSNLEQSLIWSEFAVKAYLANAKPQAEYIVTNKILPIIDVYSIEKNDKKYLNKVILTASSALYLTQPANFLLLLEKLPQLYKESAIVNISNVLMNNVYEGDNYASENGFSEIKYQQISEVVNLIKYVDDDTLLFMLIRRIAYTLKTYPLCITREQKSSVKQVLHTLLKEKLPSKTGGIKHEGYLIVCEALLGHLDIIYQDSDYNKFITNLYERAEKINNLADRSFVLSELASQCNEKAKKMRQTLLDKSFETADRIPSNKERFDRYENALNVAKDIHEPLFLNKIREINNEIFKIDNKELFPTHRRLIDIAFEHDKGLAQRLISSLDTDPARKKMTFPVSKHLDNIKEEEDAIDNYADFSKLKTRLQISRVASRNLGQLNSGKRMPKSIDQASLLLKTASNIPFSYSTSVFELFLKNIYKKTGSVSKHKGLVQNIYDSSVVNAKLTYNIVSNLSLKKSYMPSNFSLKDPEQTFVVKPGQRDAALNYVYEFVSKTEAEEIFIIDSYFSENDVRFLRGIVESCPNAHITVMTSLEGNKGKVSIDKPAFLSAWKSISADPLPNVTVIRVNKSDQTSPFHDRWIISNDLKYGLRIGTSIQSIGGGKVSEISVMSQSEIESIYNDIIDPFANQRLKIYGKDKMRYESFDL